MVSDDEASRRTWLGEDGMLQSLAADSLAIECATLSHAWVMELSELCAQQQTRYLDCPVTGLPDAAARDDLTLLLGAAGSFHVGRQADIMATDSHREDLAFPTDLRRKDTRYGVALAQGLGVAAPLGDQALAQFDHASALGFGSENESHVLDAVRDRSEPTSS